MYTSFEKDSDTYEFAITLHNEKAKIKKEKDKIQEKNNEIPQQDNAIDNNVKNPDVGDER